MFIIINNKPVNIFQITRISEVKFTQDGRWFPDSLPPGYFFIIYFQNDDKIYSSRYQCKAECVSVMENLLSYINTITSEIKKFKI